MVLLYSGLQAQEAGIEGRGKWDRGRTKTRRYKAAADTKCGWTLHPEGYPLSSHADSFPGLSIREQEGCCWCPTRVSFLGLSTHPPVIHSAVFSGVLPETHCSVTLCTQPQGQPTANGCLMRGSEDWPLASVHAPHCCMGSDWRWASAVAKALLGSFFPIPGPAFLFPFSWEYSFTKSNITF